MSGYASSPCMAHEFEDQEHDAGDAVGADTPLHIAYLLVDESGDGFRWQVRGHDLPEPLVVSDKTFDTAEAARHAGLAALDRVCRQFDAHRDA